MERKYNMRLSLAELFAVGMMASINRPICAAIRTRLLCGLLAIGITASGVGRALGQQGLHIVPSPFINNSSLSGTVAIANNDIWAVGTIAQTWSQAASPSIFVGDAVTALSPINVWAAGSRSGEHPDALEAIAHWNGSSWNVVPTMNPFPANHLSSRFNGIAAVSANDIWAIGGSFTEHWDGTSWSLLSTPSGVDLNGITALSDGTVVAVGDNTCSPSCTAVILHN
jgi:hypothetical protein